jgi:hypothetical protein
MIRLNEKNNLCLFFFKYLALNIKPLRLLNLFFNSILHSLYFNDIKEKNN